MTKSFQIQIAAPVINVTGGDGNTSSIQATGYNQRGGTGYHGFLQATNTYGSATNPNKYFRLDSSGSLQIINSAYSQVLFGLSDAGALSIPYTMTASSFIKIGGTSAQYLMADGSVSSGTSGPLTQTALSTGFSIAGGTTSKTLTISNTLTLSGTDSSTLNIGGGGTLGSAAFTASTAYQASNTNLTSVSGLTVSGTGLVKNTAGTWSYDTNTYLTSSTGVTSVNGSTGAITNVASTNVNNNFSTSQTITGSVTATSIVKSGGSSSQYLMADGSTSTISTPDIIPLDNLQYEFDGVESRFYPKNNGVIQSIANPFMLLLALNGIIQRVSFPEVVWGTPFSMDGFTVDSDGYLAFSEVPPAGSTFDARIMNGPTTQSTTNTYPFKAMDILLGAY